jgi:hypothetical protein
MNRDSAIGLLRCPTGATTRVLRVEVPPAARALCTLPHVDYEDAFLVDIGRVEDRTAEQWARAILDDAPAIVRATLVTGWSALGLQIGSPGSDGSLLGWEVRRSTPDYALLGAGSRLGMPAELLFKRQEQRLLFATFVRQENRLGRATWAAVEHVHRPIVRSLLEEAGSRERRRRHS